MNEAGFLQRIKRTESCWNWTGWIQQNGYGRFKNDEGKKIMAHRFAYELFVGPIPEGLFIDHLCRNRVCVNPAHLEVVTNRQNLERSPYWPDLGRWNEKPPKTHCPQGHEYTEDNTYCYGHGRMCRTCNIERGKARYRSIKAVQTRKSPAAATEAGDSDERTNRSIGES